MLSYQLQSAIKDLEALISLSREDIDDIKEANHNPQFDRLAIKEEKIKNFEHKKAMIDREISKLMTQHPSRPLSELLDNEQHQQLDSLKVHLSLLREVNQQYAKMVLSVGSFYNTLLERVVPTQMEGYQKVASAESSFLEVRA
ncbi:MULTISPECIES: hypothetical protein [unclassified Sulfuricurvum]|uniref:hypothetical protein n=1 Tax=unclassified Sulfuricurvum TaxID=2632390 RepID=UPI0002995DD5|nr:MULTISPECIES: hypothetical protein [unclassified Sulfuricurvum]OHD83865.1 MAG: hypothetical protein A3D90_06910 [Sulfuricurvum sp. RIFCSPHIGHO2_02_FULL_43_9]OHD86642.1 MAG: hypothetical protein A3I60_00900 [Sulfuricurvum sp. RIFCSPLOWO2_02_FULL_43_45]OHD87228.1 MAG: hypothetical protein A2W83_05730 [Sulfuricurvum sp. RIFCSPLOWO2_12_43_5]OHD87454.1 MAG: hypothetical protein A2Y52_07035 [Sulfuricurvum sp. RIFCSPLOWO2_02_43_6]OHD89465.1 MAG: hypothetical protein A3J39_10555 [Sulfuricurvum sp. 